MKTRFNNKVVLLLAFVVMLMLVGSCMESKKVAAKSGAELWAENCQRCHNTPSPTAFNSSQWKTLGVHMQTRAMLTNSERDKVVAFLQSFNH